MPTRGYGELSTADALRNDERQVFLGIVKDEVPAFFLELAGEVLPWYGDLPDPYDEEGRTDVLRQRSASLRAWAAKYVGDAPDNKWLLDFAFQLVQWWALHPEQAPHEVDGKVEFNFQWVLPSSTYVGGKPTPFIFDPVEKDTGYRVNVWGPEFGKWEDFRKRLTSLFRAQLIAYGKTQMECVARAGAKRGDVFKDAERRDFVWLARYQFQSVSYSKLSSMTPHADRRVIQRRVEKAAGRIGLTPRKPNPGGRPPSSR